MQRVEDFSELFRLKQSRQKHAEQSKPWEEAEFWRIYSPVYLQTNPRHRPEKKANKKKNQIVNRIHPISPYTGGPHGSKIWMS